MFSSVSGPLLIMRIWFVCLFHFASGFTTSFSFVMYVYEQAFQFTLLLFSNAFTTCNDKRWSYVIFEKMGSKQLQSSHVKICSPWTQKQLILIKSCVRYCVLLVTWDLEKLNHNSSWRCINCLHIVEFCLLWISKGWLITFYL